jgi:dolichyl-phosphate beta-glucosyltransferase
MTSAEYPTPDRMTPVTGDRVSLSIVIPAFNEARRITATLDQLTAFLIRQPWDWEVRVVDDGSADDTCTIVEAAARQESRIVLQREPHRGKGGAVKAGLLATRADFRFLCDADLSMPPAELPRFLPPVLQTFDLAIASREGRGATRVGEPWRRHFVGRLFNFAIRWLVVPGIADTQCGFKMFTAKSVRDIFPHVTLDGWAFDVEVLSIARTLGLRIVEVPIEWHYRAESRLSVVSDGARMLNDLFRIRSRQRSLKKTPGAPGI